ncbi:MAG: bifunctional YncE family protein/alkaline phosphatase family protein [Bacteroidetes bacterium]|nr:bifunctional YncE family protein/alkaline phosphatase family protein [Bacteroidota bacterium]
MKHIRFFSSFLMTLALIQVYSQNEAEYKHITLPNGWGISCVGESLRLGDLPLNIAVSASGRLLAVTNNGQSDQSVYLIDALKRKVLDTIVIKAAWLGLAFSRDEKSLYASGGNKNIILKYSIQNNKLAIADTLVLGKPWPEKISPAGIALDEKKNLLYVVTKENNSLYILDLRKKLAPRRFSLEGEGYTCMLSGDSRSLFISCWGCGQVQVFNTETMRFTKSYKVGSNPNDLCLSRSGKYLYVANANDNSVSCIDLRAGKVIETLNSALFPDSPAGSTTNSVALSADNKTLYIANADNNCLAVFDVSSPGKSFSKGFIPTGWYPSCVRVVNNQLWIANGKGFTSLSNPNGPNPAERSEKVNTQKADTRKPQKVQYIGGLFRGTMSIIPEPDVKKLAFYSSMVYKNTPYKQEKANSLPEAVGTAIPDGSGHKSPIKYVFYVIKENRTYDQVLGDIPEGNGDTSLVLFGQKITPNQHKLARDFVLLDNFYVDGEVSADGHNWSMGAYATDYLEKTWPGSYGGRGGDYDAEGNRKIANNKDGFLWDFCARSGVSYRTYGEFADDYKPNIPVLKDHYCRYFTSWDQDVMDTIRFRQWKRDFDSLLLAGRVPCLNTIRLINDHTQGLRAGKPTPFAQAADNDFAVGRLVEYLAGSPIWNECVIFILEDDAQNGPDHVDAHRSPAYIAGGYVKRNFVDHTPYSTASMLRTIELILGLPPMSQYDAAATPMWRCFTGSPKPYTFQTLGPFIDLSEKNIAYNEWQRMSEEFDFSKEDRAPEDLLNKVLWYAVKGADVPYPGPVRSAFVKSINAEGN